MKTVMLFRHGKSNWNANYEHDHERPLALRGQRAARAMGQWLTDMGPLPEYIVCSTALRTRETCDLAVEAGGWTVSVEYEPALYGADPYDLLYRIHEVSNDINVLLLIGHQPTWSETTALLTRTSVRHFPTATMARIDIPVGAWAEVEFGHGSLVWLQIPKRLPLPYRR